MIVPDDETFRGNILGTYNVIKAAANLGVQKIIIASSVSTYGVTYAQGDVDYPSFPIEEDLDVDPMDTYAISKV
jgi:nucleoside-diphosphate-sugar epimerase